MKRMKKILSVVFILTILAGIVPAGAWASLTHSDIEQSETADASDVVIASNSNNEPGNTNDRPASARQTPADASAGQQAQQEQNPRITAIEVRGNERIPTSQIMDVIRSNVGDLLLEPRLRSDVQAIYEMGYFTDVKVDTPYHAGGIKLVFRVQENPVVRSITIVGNEIVSDERILSLMQTTPGEILNMKTLNTDMAEINYYYNETLGYILEPTHISDVRWTPQGELILTVQEGLPITAVRITGSTLYTEERLMELINIRPTMILDSAEIRQATTTLSNFYEEEGYILDTIRPQVDYQTGVVTFQIIEAVVEDIRIQFDRERHKTKEETVLRNIRTEVGEVLQRNKLQRDIERLNNLGFFSRVNVVPEPGTEPGNVVLVFELQEQKTGLATIGVGYTGGGSGALRSGITGAISFTEKNLGGTGQAVSAAWQRGVNVDVLSGSYYNPAINKNQDSFGINLYSQRYEELRRPIAGAPEDQRYAFYDDVRRGGTATYGRRVTDDFRLFGSYRRENLQIRESENSPVPLPARDISSGNLSAVILGALYDDRNDIFDPTTGNFADATITKAGGFMGGDYNFNKYQVETRKYFPIGRRRRSTIALRAWGGVIQGDRTPVTETFYVGGTDTLRGYPENAFFGTRMAVLNAEYRFPLGDIRYLKGAVFADAGNAWFPGQRSKLYTNAGVGLRIVFPTLGLGVIRVDYAVGERGGRTSIGIGQTF
jgi:outer membrane protein insertion porin family